MFLLCHSHFFPLIVRLVKGFSAPLKTNTLSNTNFLFLKKISYEISITLPSSTILITIPKNSAKRNSSDCEETLPLCVSGDTFSTATSSEGCEVKKKRGGGLVVIIFLTLLNSLFWNPRLRLCVLVVI